MSDRTNYVTLKSAPPHPDYGIAECCRAKVLIFAATHGVSSAAKLFGVHPSTIHLWRHRVPQDHITNPPPCQGLAIKAMKEFCDV